MPFKSLEGSHQIIQDFLNAKESLIQGDLRHFSGLKITRRFTDLMDGFVRSLFEKVGSRRLISENHQDGWAIVALGGYGRRELCLHSDVDLMVIHGPRPSPEINGIIRRALYPLWDAKLEVGHTILTVQECIRLALNDFRMLTAVLDSRFLLGSRSFYRLFREAFWARTYRERETLFKRFLVSEHDRLEKQGGEGDFVEPDLKEGLGGLRDLHLMAWMAMIYLKCQRLNQIGRFAAFAHFEFDKLGHSKSFLLKVRNHLHIVANRKEDRLLLPHQKAVSQRLGYTDGDLISGPERLLKELYLHLNRIRYGHEEFQAKMLDMIHPLPLDPTPAHLPSEFQVMKGNIVLKSGTLSEKDPLVILKALDEANQRGLFLGSGFIWEAKKIFVKKRRQLVQSMEAKKRFLNLILKPKNPQIIRLALEMGVISLFIPEFKRIRNLAQFGFYHVMTIDLHSLKTLEVIHQISEGIFDDQWPLLKRTFLSLKNPDWLYLAGLLHDIGKGVGKDHSKRGSELIPKILTRLGIEGEALEMISFLVRHHLLLVNVSQRRDLNDEKTSVQVAQAIQPKGLLDLLFLLTVADSFSTGPLARSDWRIMLLVELYLKVKRILERGVLASPEATSKIASNKIAVLKILRPDFPKQDILELMDQVPLRYFLSAQPEEIKQHFTMALTLGEKKHMWNLHKLRNAPVTRVLQCTYDRPGLFSKMVGVFALNNMAVLSANIFTLKNGLAFDTYEVTNPLDPYREAEQWDRTLEDLLAALEDRLPLDDLIRTKRRLSLHPKGNGAMVPQKIAIKNDVSDFFTVVETSSVARVGLLYDLAKDMFELGLDIRFAKVISDEEKMTGVFYVRNSDGQKILEDKQIASIRQSISALMG